MLPHALYSLAAGLPGGWELWIILFIILVLFGTRLPKVARSLGQGINEFKKGINEPLEAGDAAAKSSDESAGKPADKTAEKAEATKSDE